LLDYEDERMTCLEWLLEVGKNLDEYEGYALGTVEPRSYRMDQLYRWVWDTTGEYTPNVKPDHADPWMKHVAQAEYSSTHKTNCQKALQMLFKWRHHERGTDQWEPAIKFSEDSSSQPRDYLTRQEREQIRTAE
jgi:hypothetical protein